jgi:hypothetical protein
MKSADNPLTAVPENKAVVTFYRPAYAGAAHKPTIVRKVKGGVEFVGAIEAGCRIRDVVDPGEHEYSMHELGMSNLLKAKLEANKAYYVKVAGNNVGMISADSVNHAVHRDKFADGDTAKEIKGTTLREKNEKAQALYEGRKRDLLNSFFKAQDIYNKEESPELRKVNTLYPEDGIKELY